MVYLVDASVYIFRTWYSQQPDQRDGEGNPTHALYGFAPFLGDLIERRTPQYVAVAFDECRGSAHRHTLLPSYKAQWLLSGRESVNVWLMKQGHISVDLIYTVALIW